MTPLKTSPFPWRRSERCRELIQDASGRFVADVSIDHSRRSGEEEDANGDLIIAAPDLLEALEMVRDAVRDNHADNGEPLPPPVAWNKINAAISKATGGTR